MDAHGAFKLFVKWAILPAKRDRLLFLCDSRAGRKKVLHLLHHEFDRMIRPEVTRSSNDQTKGRDRPCYVFCDRVGFGVGFATVSEAYCELSLDDSWLIVSDDGTTAMFRPEERWDDEKLLAADEA